MRAAAGAAVVGQRQVEAAQGVQPNQGLLILVGRDVWVEANVKGTQVSRMRMGNRADLHLDDVPGVVFHGHVTSLSPASGARFALPPPDPKKSLPSLASVDWQGILLLILGLGSLQIVLEQGQQYAWFEDRGIVALTITALFSCPAFIWWELRHPNPAVQLRVLRHRSLAAGSVLSMIVGIGLYGTVFLIPIFAQGVLHFTAIQTGLLMLPGAMASGATMLVLSKKVQQLDPRRVIAAGSICTSLVMFALAGINPNTGEEALFWPLIFRGIGTVLMFLPLSLAALGDLSPEEINGGSAFYNLTRQLGGSFGIALLTSLLSHGRDYHRAYLSESAGALSLPLRLRLLEFERMLQARGADPHLAHRRALELVDRQVDLQASLLAYADIFHWLALLFLAAIPLVLLLRGPKARRAS